MEFLILGPLEARIEGGMIALGAPRQRLLLAALLLAAPRPLRREQLIDEIWGPTPPASARHAVEVYVSRLRGALGQAAIVSEPGTSYAAAGEVDARRFEALASGAPGEAQLAEALALWRGPVLADLAYEGPLRTEIARLQELMLVAREQLADRRLQRGGHAEALADLQELVAGEPLRERARGLLMLALYRAGRQAEALDVYRAGRELLVEELGLEPGAPLRELQAAILHHDPAISDPVTHRRRTLPAPPTPLIGREREIEELAGLLRGVARLVTLTGPGGTGKTRLALGAAEALLDEFADGAHFVDLSPLRDPATVALAIAHAVGLDADTELVAQLRGRHLLLVLDNFEQLMDAAPAVGALLTGAPEVRVLATSRTRLDIYGEHEFAVDPLEHDEGVELFCARARARNRRFIPTAAVAHVVARVERLPLAIELVASHADEMNPEEMVAGLPILELATGGPRDAPDRHRALRATVDWSLGLLDEPDRRRFAALGVFAGGLDAAAAVAVLDAAPADLDRLAGQSLLRRLPERWAMLETLRERALELLDVAAPVRARHAAHYLELAERSEQALKGPSLGIIARDRGDAAGARAAFEEAADAYRSLDDHHRLADSLSNLAFVAIDQEQLDEAAALFGESIALDRAFDNQWGVAQNLTGQALLSLARGAPDEAAALLAESVQALRPLGDRLSLVRALELLGATAAVRSDHAFAARLWGAATAQRDAAGEPRTVADAAVIDRHLDASRAALGLERFAAAATAGAALDLEAALAEALTC